MTFREQLIKKATTNCRHFNGIQNDCCSAGVNYEQLREGDRYALPCLKNFVNLGKLDPAMCEKFAVMTQEEAEKYADDTVDQSTKTMAAMAAARDHATKAGLKKGNGGKGHMPCPIKGCPGILFYSVASYNGHLWGRCDTGTCIAWMQ